jgi:tRNA-specific 2-thiouridylase
MRKSLKAEDATWVAGAPAEGTKLTGKTRNRQADAACTVEEASGTGVCVDFADPQWAVTPGQSVVLYDREVCLGGGIITT